MIYLPTNYDFGNRGCEAITRGIIEILGAKQIVNIYSRTPEKDKKIDLKTANLVKCKSSSHVRSFYYRLLRNLTHNVEKKLRLTVKEDFQFFLSDIKKDKQAICFSTGGDMFCYDDNSTIYLEQYLDKKVTTILYGCSIGKENLSPMKIKSLNKYDLIVARESITEQLLKEKLNLDHVYCFPDPAFALSPESVDSKKFLPDGEVIGINLSNFVGANVGKGTMFNNNVVKLIEYILENTTYNIAFFPHVFWKNQDDRVVCKNVENIFGDSSRIRTVETQKLNYCQIRYLISQCRFFVGARTHSMISAYSCCVPSLALGYSVKSIGIAKDLGLPNEAVINYKTLKKENDLLNRFLWLIDNEDIIRNILCNNIVEYKKRTYQFAKILDDFIIRGKYN